MLKKDFIIRKTRCLLIEFISPIIQKADKPRKKFLRQVVAAILLSGSLVVTELAHWIHDDCSDIFYRLKRLLNHLVRQRQINTIGNVKWETSHYDENQMW